jgi:hypothetical protein
MSPNKRLFLVLWAAGIAGVLSFLLVDISAIVAAFPVPEGAQPPELPPPALLKLATTLQPAVLTTAAIVLGIWLAPKVGLHAPAAEAFANRKPVWPVIRPHILPAVGAGIACGLGIIATWVIAKPFMDSGFVTRAQEFNAFIPHAVRILYGGFTEEILLRWGVMTLLVWLEWRIFQRGRGPARAVLFGVAIALSALLFGAGHLPLASALAGKLTVPIVIYVLIANSLFGIVAGLLYWKRGLESAMLAHITAHVVLIAAISSARI